MATRSPIKRWVHISEEGGDPWVLQIWSSANSSIKAGRSKKLTRRVSELGVHISTRLNLVAQVIRRINEGTAAVNVSVFDRPAGHDFSPGTQAYTLRIDKIIKFRLLLDIDAFLFELNSLYGLWCEFFKELHLHAAKKMPGKTANEAIRQVVGNGGGSTSWIDELARERNYFMHRGAPYIAIDVSRAKSDLLFLKSNVIDLRLSKDYVRLSELNSMVQGFRVAKPIVSAYLAALYA